MGSELPKWVDQTIQASTPERESKLPQPSPKKMNLTLLDSGPDCDVETPKQSQVLPSGCASPTSSEKDETTYPEGGVSAWLVVFGSWCAMAVSLGAASSFGVFQSYFITHQLSSYSPGVVGWIFSLYVFLAFAGGIVIGPIFDKHGPRWLMLAGSVCVCMSMFLVGICRKYWQFLVVFGILGGGGSCLLYTPSIAAVGHFFKEKRGNATGIVFSSSAIGGTVLPLMLLALIPRLGFMWSAWIVGFIYVCLCAIACTLIHKRLPPAKNANTKPDFRIFGDPAFAFTVLAAFLLQLAYLVPLSYITSYALYHGYSTAFSDDVLVFLNVGSIFGRWLPGLCCDRMGRYNSIIIMTFFTVVSVLGIWLPMRYNHVGLALFAFTFGFGSGSILTLTAACVGQLCETRDYGRYLSTAYTIAAFGSLTGIPIGGELIVTNHGAYWGLIVFVGVCYAGALVALFVVRILRAGWELTAVY